MNIQEAFISGLTNWKNFHGRACRSEFWFFYLSLSIISFVIALLEVLLGIMGMGVLSILFNIIIIVPYIAVTTRRFHDINMSGWWQLIPITIIGIIPYIYWLTKKGDDTNNKYGSNPL